MSPSPQDVTRLLLDWGAGDPQALDRLTPLVYEELRRLAGRYLRRERSDHTLQSTALVHEAYMRLVDQRVVKWQNRAQFFGLAAEMIRRILVDHARAHRAEKRGGEAVKVALDEALDAAAGRDVDLVRLDEALKELAQLDPQQSRIVELRYFAGLTIDETAQALGVSPATVKRDWAVAKAWLRRQMSNSAA